MMTMSSRMVGVFFAFLAMAVSGHITAQWGLQMEEVETRKKQSKHSKGRSGLRVFGPEGKTTLFGA